MPGANGSEWLGLLPHPCTHSKQRMAGPQTHIMLHTSSCKLCCTQSCYSLAAHPAALGPP